MTSAIFVTLDFGDFFHTNIGKTLWLARRRERRDRRLCFIPSLLPDRQLLPADELWMSESRSVDSAWSFSNRMNTRGGGENRLYFFKLLELFSLTPQPLQQQAWSCRNPLYCTVILPYLTAERRGNGLYLMDVPIREEKSMSHWWRAGSGEF